MIIALIVMGVAMLAVVAANIKIAAEALELIEKNAQLREYVKQLETTLEVQKHTQASREEKLPKSIRQLLENYPREFRGSTERWIADARRRGADWPEIEMFLTGEKKISREPVVEELTTEI